MNRRDFAKGLAALPFAGAVKSFASICNSTCKPDPQFLWVVLQGPFAVVINNNDGSIRAFTSKDNEHMFAFNGHPAANDTTYHFQLQLSGRSTPTPCVQNQFPRFCAEKIRFDFSNTQDDFITIDLPGPDKIIIADSSFQADMQDGTTSLPVPGDHILEYDVTPNAITMTASFNNTTVTLDPTPTPDLAFIFEVGLVKSLGGGDSDPNGTHAKTFYNDHLLPRFLDLTGKPERTIKQISRSTTPNSQKHRALAQPRKLAPKRSNTRPGQHGHVQQPERVYPFATTYECKAGGLLVSSP